MIAEPLEKWVDIVNEINSVLGKFHKIDEFSMSRIGKKIKSLEKTNYGEFCFCWMMLHSARRNQKEFLRYQELSEKHGFNGSDATLNYATGFLNAGLIFRALDYAKKSYEILKTPETLFLLKELAYYAGRFEESLSYFNELKKMKKDDGVETHLTEEIVLFMNKNFLSDDDISSIIKIVEDLLQESNVRIHATRISPSNDYKFLSIDFKIEVNPVISSYLDAALSERIIDEIANEKLTSAVLLKFSGDENHKESTLPITIKEITSEDNKILRFSPYLVLKPYIDDESGFVMVDDDELNIHTYALNRETLLQELSPELFMLWNEYAQENPDNLTPKAKKLRENLLGRFRLEAGY